jgi:NAD-dependent SIR2 family protein deacetylase
MSEDILDNRIEHLISELQQLRLDIKKEKVQKRVDKIINGILAKKYENVIVMLGAGASTSAGIPDFRSAGGLYDQLRDFGVEKGETVFDIDYFRKDSSLFYRFASMLLPDVTKFKPTITHKFVKKLNDYGVLLRCYTQNIDSLEMYAGIPEEKMVYAHGNFNSFHCLECKYRTELTDEMKKLIQEQKIVKCPYDDTALKPSVVFFGEDLPKRYHDLSGPDFLKCDCLIVIGTSLKVYPFAGLVRNVKHYIPRLLVNREEVGNFFDFQKKDSRDVFIPGDCDDICQKWVDIFEL